VGEGHSNQVLALSDKAGVPLAETQQDLTPLQRHVTVLTLQKQQQKKQKQQGGGSGGRPVNSMRQPHGGGSGQTTTYTNKNYE